jgi:hypothetical protein
LRVEFGDRRKGGGEGGDPHEDVLESGQIHGRRAAVAVEQRESPQAVQDVRRLRVGHRREAHLHVAEQLDRRAARGARDDRAEAGTADDADQHLDSGRRHRLHEEALGAEGVMELARRARDRGCAVQPQPHGSRVALVQQAGHDRLSAMGPLSAAAQRPAACGEVATDASARGMR